MPRYYKRGALGRMIEAEGGSSDPDLAEVRMAEEEYRDLWGRIRNEKRYYEGQADRTAEDDSRYVAG